MCLYQRYEFVDLSSTGTYTKKLNTFLGQKTNFCNFRPEIGENKKKGLRKKQIDSKYNLNKDIYEVVKCL